MAVFKNVPIEWQSFSGKEMRQKHALIVIQVYG